MAGEPDTEKLVRPVRREAHRNLVGNPIKARCVYPIAVKAGEKRKRCSLRLSLVPCNKVRAGLPEPQPPMMEVHILWQSA
jgi:hypothetical protein